MTTGAGAGAPQRDAPSAGLRGGEEADEHDGDGRGRHLGETITAGATPEKARRAGIRRHAQHPHGVPRPDERGEGREPGEREAHRPHRCDEVVAVRMQTGEHRDRPELRERPDQWLDPLPIRPAAPSMRAPTAACCTPAIRGGRRSWLANPTAMMAPTVTKPSADRPHLRVPVSCG
ncbi:hypothetical protein ABIB15_000486 [Marisediminicola sp. UYEF4]|uniref:hypothetical protein n=1 Tax=Marisediminicola sp. UYEF4 TaxID=1756384 RepID=UPI003398DF46